MESDPPPRPSYRVRAALTGGILVIWLVVTAFSRPIAPFLASIVDRAEIALGLDVSLGKGT